MKRSLILTTAVAVVLSGVGAAGAASAAPLAESAADRGSASSSSQQASTLATWSFANRTSSGLTLTGIGDYSGGTILQQWADGKGHGPAEYLPVGASTDLAFLDSLDQDEWVQLRYTATDGRSITVTVRVTGATVDSAQGLRADISMKDGQRVVILR